MTDHTMEVQVGNLNLKIPIYMDENTTRLLVQRVNQRLREIERQSTKIDSHAFALQAALSFAAEAEDRKLDSDEDSRELMAQLDQMNESLEDLLAGLR